MGQKNGAHKIDFNRLKTAVQKPDAKTTQAQDTSESLGEFLFTVSNFMAYCNNLSEYEVSNITMSMQNWMLRRTYTSSRMAVNIGDFFYTDLGMTYKLECSYPHSVIVLEEIGNMLLVAPTTTSQEYINDGYHPTLNPNGNEYIRRVQNGEDDLGATCAIMLSNIRTINPSRLLAKKGTMLNINDPSSLFREIKEVVFRKYMPKEHIEYVKLQTALEDLQDEKRKVEEQLEKAIGEYEKLQRRYDLMSNKIKENPAN